MDEPTEERVRLSAERIDILATMVQTLRTELARVTAERDRINEIQLYSDGPQLYRSITAQRRRQRDGTSLWAICERGNCFTKDAEWEYEPFSSSRDDAWLERARWPTLEAAVAFFEANREKALAPD